MEKSDEEAQTYPIWINRTERIVSFTYVKGYEVLYFPSQEEKMAYAIGNCSFGYRIQ